MGSTNFKAIGFSTTLTEANVKALTKKFRSAPSRRLKTGTFIGVDQLATMVASLKKGGYDGLQICYGIGEPAPGDTFGKYELVMTEVLLKDNGDTVDATKKGAIYSSVEDNSTEPATLGCPPLKCPPGGDNG